MDLFFTERGISHMEFNFNSKEHLITFIQSEIITTAEATELLNCSRQYLDELVSKGKITPVKTINRVRLYWRDDISSLHKSKC
ncbi:helix-turn-helix domain-containing protein [Niameybacter sp.]|uniref:helix-turn-helix domain-containing protein n=2 Tax=Niameybacter sp. TaxID=2033640 RepID=UPI002FE6F04C